MTTDYVGLALKFSARYIPMLAPFAATADIRYYLNGLRIEAAKDRPGVYLAATDGHRLSVIYDATGQIHGDDDRGVILRLPPEFVTACKKTKGHVFEVEVVASNTRVSVTNGFGGIGGNFERYVMPGHPWVDGKFPDWKAILPQWDKLNPGFANDLNIKYLADYSKLVNSRFLNSVSFWQESQDRAVVVQIPTVPEFVSLLMPLRADKNREAKLADLESIIKKTKKEESSCQQ